VKAKLASHLGVEQVELKAADAQGGHAKVGSGLTKEAVGDKVSFFGRQQDVGKQPVHANKCHYGPSKDVARRPH
jgi:hypothetical protein